MADTNLRVDGKEEEAVINGIITFMENAWAGRQQTLENRLHNKLLHELKANGNRVALEIVEDSKAENIEELIKSSKLGYFKAHTDKGTIFFVSAENGDALQSILNIDAASRNDVSRHFTSESIVSLADIDPKFEFVTFKEDTFTAEEDNISDIRIYQHGMVANTDGKETRIPSTFLFNPKGSDFGTYLIDMSAQLSAKEIDPEYYNQKNAQIEYDKQEIKKFIAKVQMGEAVALGDPRNPAELSLQYKLDKKTQTMKLYRCYSIVTPIGLSAQEEEIDIKAKSVDELLNEVSFHAEKIYNMGVYNLDLWEQHNCPKSERPTFTDSKFHDFLKKDFSDYIAKYSIFISDRISHAYNDKSALEKANKEAELIMDDLAFRQSDSAKKLYNKFIERGLTDADWEKFISLERKNLERLMENEQTKDAKTIAKEIFKEKEEERTL